MVLVTDKDSQTHSTAGAVDGANVTFQYLINIMIMINIV